MQIESSPSMDGSAVMGDGAITPQQALPAQIESELAASTNLKWCVVNRSTGGGVVHDCLNRLVFDRSELNLSPDCVVLYFGFNEANYLISKYLLLEVDGMTHTSMPAFLPAGVLREFEVMGTLMGQYSIRYLGAKIARLGVSAIVSPLVPSVVWTSNSLPARALRSFLAALSVRPAGRAQEMLQRVTGTRSKALGQTALQRSDRMRAATARAAVECASVVRAFVATAKLESDSVFIVLQPFDTRSRWSAADATNQPWFASAHSRQPYVTFYDLVEAELQAAPGAKSIAVTNLLNQHLDCLPAGYVDEVHIGPDGNRAVARRLAHLIGGDQA